MNVRVSIKGHRDGFAMPLVLLTLLVLTVGVAASFSRVTNEMRRNQDRQADTDAFVYAQGAMERYAIDRPALGFPTFPPAAVESVRIAYVDGYADVVSRLVRPKIGNSLAEQAIYLLSSRGVRQNGGSASWMPQSESTVMQYAFFREGRINILSAWTSLSGLLKNGDDGIVSGTDNCAMEPAVGGVAVPTIPGYEQNGGVDVPQGDPPILDLGTQTEANDAVGIDWNGIINQNLIIPDITIPPDSWPTTWPAGWWPVIRVNGNLTLEPPGGQGTLIVTGNLTLKGSTSWEGIILVGGAIFSNGENVVYGGVISGLNLTLGISVPESDLGNGEKTFIYDSCAIASATNRFAALVLISKTWSNSWPIW